MLPSTHPQTIAFLFRNVAARCGSREALVADNARLSYADLDARTDRLARELQQQGVDKQTTLGVLLLDGLAMVELTIASAKLGATLLAINWRLAPGELSYILEDSAPDLCFVSDCFVDLFEQAGGTDPRIVETGNPAGAIAALEGLPAGELPATEVEIQPLDRWYMLYTSGTTGRPKGCQHNQRGYFTNVLAWLSQLGITEHDCLMCINPLFHVHGFAQLLCGLVAGAKIVIPPRDIDAEGMLRLTSEEGITVQAMWQNVVEIGTLQAQLQLPLKLRLLIAPGGALPPEFIEQLLAMPGMDMRFIYGQTEAGCWVSMLGPADQIARPKSCGKAMPHMATRIVDDEGNDLPQGEIGELLVKGEGITFGYHNLPEATAETIVDGWLHTGDLFREDEDGFLYITGRKKELIKSGGENVYPVEVDAVLVQHPEILDAAVVGVPDERWGEAVKAFVVAAPGTSPSRESLVAFCREHIAGFKRPRYIEFVDEIPRDFNLKIQRKKLSERETTADQAVD
ncbi:MAG: AMP-binding protein [Pseudomonadota bacterium]